MLGRIVTRSSSLDQTWQKKMDRNSRYFHAIAGAKGRKKAILSLCITGEDVQCPRRIKNHVKGYFKQLYK